MTDFTGASCPVCKGDFTAERPVICPDCGAPYHRDCWAVSGRCSFEAAHKNGFTWKMPEPVKAAPEAEIRTEPIPAGPTLGSLFDHTIERQSLYDKTPPPEQRYVFGVTEKEIACFQGEYPNKSLRFMKYRRIAAGQKISLNLFAAFFSPFYFFYSRMRGAGVIVALFSFLLRLPASFDMYLAITGTPYPESAEALLRAGGVLAFLGLGFQVALALFFDYFYLVWMSSKIKFVRHQYMTQVHPEVSVSAEPNPSLLGEEYYAALQRIGRPSLLYMALDGLAVTVLLSLVLYSILYIMV